jgi:quercetin 2,3-dioxygenase
MPTNRTIKEVLRSKPTIEGAGVHLKRAFGFSEVPRFDPFLLLDDFRGDQPRQYQAGFPWHPHRGIETITYMLSGTVEHGDSLGNSGVIGPGDMQWMTAGSGIVHQEMPHGDGRGVMGGFQLWANLPASHKMMAPRYREVVAEQVPRVALKNGATVKVLCGRVQDAVGPVQDVVIDPEYLDVSVPPGAEFSHPTRPGHTVFAYLIEGQACFCNQKDPFAYDVQGSNYFDYQRHPFLGSDSLVLFGDGEQVTVTADDQGARFLLVAGRPLRESVAWHGPIVMNTRQELQQAFEEYAAGTFIKKGSHPKVR